MRQSNATYGNTTVSDVLDRLAVLLCSDAGMNGVSVY